MKVRHPFLRLLALILIGSSALAPAQTPTPTPASPYAPYIARLKAEMEQYKVEVEKAKLIQMDMRTRKQEAAAKAQEANIKRYQNTVTLKQQEMTMYQQQDALTKQPLSPNPNIAAVQNYIRQMTFEKARLGLQQTAANQAGNTREAARIGQEMNNRQLTIQTKTQEIKLMQMQEKLGK